jgi:uncharacterized protein YodC (DUF2158 family)
MARQRKYAIGDKVHPRGGGPSMMVDHYGEFDLVYCWWLDKKNNPQCKPFREEILEKLPFPSAWSGGSQVRREHGQDREFGHALLRGRSSL